MSKYEGKHRLKEEYSEAETQEIARIEGMFMAPIRTIEDIAANREPAWVAPLELHGTLNLVPPPPKIKTFTGPPVWRLRDWMNWIISWRLDGNNEPQQDGYRLV